VLTADVIHLESENKVLRKLVKKQGDKIYETVSPAMRDIERLVLKVAPTDSTVLITGPSGSGKGVIAQSIHRNSDRKDRPFIPVNCGAIPENLLESEFFGHTKGAFTGASKAKRGLFVEAGSEQSRKINTRIVTATNKDLDEMVKEGSFREDLYFRLNVFHIPLPSLEQRKEDLPGLIKHFVKKESRKMGLSDSIEIHPNAMQSLLAYSWPGNVRELQNALARSLILSENGIIDVGDLPHNIAIQHSASPYKAGSGYDTLKQQLRNYELVIINTAIEDAAGDRKLAAKQLGIGVSSLYRKLENLTGETNADW